MHTVIVAAIRTFFGWLLGQAVLKGIALTILAGLLTFLGEWLWSLLPSWLSVDSLNTIFNLLPPGVWWFFDFVRLPQGAPVVVMAVVLAFLIRRIPLIG